MAELFDIGVGTINYHLKEIYKTGELEEGATTRKIRIVQRKAKEKCKMVGCYNLGAIISVE